MSHRISTAGIHNSVISQLMSRQSELARTQNQVASGKRVQTPADDPIAATRIVELERSRTQLEQYARNAVSLQNRLSTAEQAMSDIGGVLDRVRELAIQANSAGVDAASRTSIAAEVRSRIEELQTVANRRDAGGEYLFAGFSTTAQPFSRDSAGVNYSGDQGTRTLQISPDQRIADSVSGYELFMNVAEGNGTFAVAQGVHTGTGSIDNGRVINNPLWVDDNFTVSFTAPDTWEVRNSANALVATGAYTAGNAISFNGGQVIVSGAPATGDTFTITPARNESIFTTLDQFASALESGADDPVARSTLNTDVNAALGQIDQAMTHVLNRRADVGARLAAIDSSEESRDALDFELKSSLSDLQDLDYADAVSRMNLQLTGLQAAQAAYAKISQLSLFNYL